MFHARHTVADVLTWVDKDALGGVQAFVKGMLSAGAAVADLVFWAASRAIEVTREVVKELLASGATMASLDRRHARSSGRRAAELDALLPRYRQDAEGRGAIGGDPAVRGSGVANRSPR